jgi:hypothetical protein
MTEERIMAKPPEPIEELLPQAVWVLDAEVVEVVQAGPKPPRIDAPRGSTSVGQKTASQVVKLKVRRVLRGQPTEEVTAEKPEAGYALRPGNHGPFLIDATNRILGRYGPDTWSFDRIEQALSERAGGA